MARTGKRYPVGCEVESCGNSTVGRNTTCSIHHKRFVATAKQVLVQSSNSDKMLAKVGNCCNDQTSPEYPTQYAKDVAPYVAAISAIRYMIGELFGPIASLESEEATLLRGPLPYHEVEAIVEALHRIKAAL